MVKIEISEGTRKLLEEFRIFPEESYDDILRRALTTRLKQKEGGVHYKAKKLLCDRLWDGYALLEDVRSGYQIGSDDCLGGSNFYTIEYPFYYSEGSNHLITNYYDEGFCPAFEICKKRAEKLGLEYPPCREMCKYRSKETNVAYMVEKFAGILPVVIADIAHGHEGRIKEVFEITYKNPLSKFKRELYMKSGLTVVEVKAKDILKCDLGDPIPCKVYSRWEDEL